MSNRIFRSLMSSKQYGCLQPKKHPLSVIPADGSFRTTYADLSKIKEFKSNYEAQSNDVLLNTYVRCGSYLLNKLCVEIMRHSDKDNVHELYKNADIGTYSIPFAEHIISEYTQKEINERIEWTSDTLRFWFAHTPINCIPFKTLHKNTKIITVIRNPKDMIASQYHYMSQVAIDLNMGHNTMSTIDDYVSYFLRGIGIGGCYFDFYEQYWKASKSGFSPIFGDVNVLFLYYEDIINENTKKENIEKIALFLGKDLDENDYDSIIKKTEFKEMRKELTDNPQSFELHAKDHLKYGRSGYWEDFLNTDQSDLIDETMYFKWAQNANDIKYYLPLFDKFADCNQGYHP